MSLYQAASLSADCMTNALAFFLVGYTLHLAFGSVREIGVLELSVLGLVSVSLSLCKNIYFSFSLLMLLIPAEKYSSNKSRILWSFGMLFGNLFFVLYWGYILSACPIHFLSYVDPQEQIRLIITRPYYFIYVLAKNVVKKFLTLARGYVGIFGWADTFLPDVHVFGWIALLLWAGWTDGKSDIRIGRHRILLLILFLFCLLMTFILVYITWNPPGSDMINGLQGRYLIPIVPLFLLVFHNRRFCMQTKIKVFVILSGTILSLTLASLKILHRFYL